MDDGATAETTGARRLPPGFPDGPGSGLVLGMPGDVAGSDEPSVNPWIQTVGGRRFDLVAPDPDSIDIRDIATALSHLGRFTGHTTDFYTVAQHSCLACDAASPVAKPWALMHDAAEAFIGDVSTPLKVLLGETYRAVERRVVDAICLRYRLAIHPAVQDEVRQIDRRLLVTERNRFLAPPPVPWSEDDDGVEPLQIASGLTPWPPEKARRHFLDRALKVLGEEA